MGRKTSLREWCEAHGRQDILSEWAENDNLDLYRGLRGAVDDLEYACALRFCWVCSNGHVYSASPVERTLLNAGCPICEGRENGLPVGTKYGCLTIISGFPDGWKDKVLGINARIKTVMNNRQAFLNEYDLAESDMCEKHDGKSLLQFDICVKQYRSEIENIRRYRVRCKCGKEFDIREFDFLKKKHRWCGCDCGLKQQAEKKHGDKLVAYRKSYERRFADGYDADLTGDMHETLRILSRVADCEVLHEFKRVGKTSLSIGAHSGYYQVYKQYKCCCELCGKEYVFKHSDFDINPPTAYGCHAYNGYWSSAKCDCHPISSFQWIVVKILKEHNVKYRSEVYFEGLYGVCGCNHLRFDFCVFNSDDSVKCLIECQGEQHFEAVEEFGGEFGLVAQKNNDDIKREFCNAHGICLVEICRVKKGLVEHVAAVLKDAGVIDNCSAGSYS